MGHGVCENWCISALWSLENYFGRKMKGFLQVVYSFTDFACPFLSRSKMIKDVVTIESDFPKYQAVFHSEAL